jgi:hypothetical protein
MPTHERSVVAESSGARGQTGRARRNSDRQREFRWAFRRSGLGAGKRLWQRRSNRDCQAAAAYAGREREHASQVVVQGTALIAGIGAVMLMRLSTLVMDMVAVHVSDRAGLGHVGSNVLVILEGVLDMGGDQRRDTGDLGEQKEPEENGAETSKLGQREHCGFTSTLLLDPIAGGCCCVPAGSCVHLAVYPTDQAPRLAKFDIDVRRADHRSVIRSSE